MGPHNLASTADASRGSCSLSGHAPGRTPRPTTPSPPAPRSATPTAPPTAEPADAAAPAQKLAAPSPQHEATIRIREDVFHETLTIVQLSTIEQLQRENAGLEHRLDATLRRARRAQGGTQCSRQDLSRDQANVARRKLAPTLQVGRRPGAHGCAISLGGAGRRRPTPVRSEGAPDHLWQERAPPLRKRRGRGVRAA